MFQIYFFLSKMPKAPVLPIIDDVAEILQNVQQTTTASASTQTMDPPSSTAMITELQQKVSGLEHRHMYMTRALSVLELVQIQPQTRLQMINEHSKLLLEDIAPVLNHLGSSTLNVWDVEAILQGIITRWAESECFVDMLGSTSISQYPMSRSRPLYSFQNYLDIYDPAKGTPSDAFVQLLGMFSIRLPGFRSQLSIIRPNILYQDVVHGYLSGVVVCILFHQKDKSAPIYRYPRGVPLWTDYRDVARYQEDVIQHNCKDLTESVRNVVGPRPPSGLLDLSAQRNFYKTQNKRKNTDL